jgi:hypothetical protein
MASVIFQFAFIIFRPAAVSVRSTYLARGSIARPWWFLLTVTLVLNVAYVVLFYLVAAPMFGGFDFLHGKKKWRAGALAPKVRPFPILGVWNDTLLVAKICSGWAFGRCVLIMAGVW